MGTPKKKQESRRELISPAVAEKIRLLMTGKRMSQELKVDMFPNVLEGVKDILLPLVSWLDKLIAPEVAFADCPVPKVLEKRRGVRLFESGVMDIWLTRSGKWFLCFRGSDRPKRAHREVNSRQLAKIMLRKSDYFLRRSLRNADILEEIPFLKDIAFYNVMLVQFVSQCFESVKTLIKAREERLCIMKEWLNLLHEFGQSLDPLVSHDRTVLAKGYSIFGRTRHGESRCTADYLCPEALGPFWEVLENREPEDRGYREHVTEHDLESLEDLLERIGYIFDEIKKTKEDATANSIFGFSSGRLPFTEEEVAVLKEIVDSVAV